MVSPNSASPPFPSRSAELSACLDVFERVHHSALEKLTAVLKPARLRAVEGLLLYRIGDRAMSGGELLGEQVYRGDVFATADKLVERGLLARQAEASLDGRPVNRVRRTPKAASLVANIDAFYARMSRDLATYDRSFDLVGLWALARGLDAVIGAEPHTFIG